MTYCQYYKGGTETLKCTISAHISGEIYKTYKQSRFLATLVALHFTPVSESVSDSFGLA